jgi:sortase A
VVGGIGRVLIATGLLMFAFVAYQLWGTGLEYAQAQNRLENDFDQLLAGAATSTTVTATTEPGSSVEGTAPTTPATSASTVAPTTSPPATVPDFSAGDVMARIEIPSIGLDSYVVAGVDPGDLKKGPGHYPATPMPGQLGNAAVAGHRTTYGQPFYRLDEVNPGDEIVLTTVQGRFVYRATGSEVVGPDRSDVVATTDPDVARLTLTTCHPRYTAANRLIVYADLDVDASAAPQPAVIEPTATTPSTLPGGPAATAGPAPVSGTTSPSTATTEPDPGGDAAQPSSSGGGGVSAETDDAFAHGWFSDDAAFPQVALWGFAVSAVAIGAYLVSRRFRNNWIGALVGIVPFVVALYFFFQNVNRLLPAAL